MGHGGVRAVQERAHIDVDHPAPLRRVGVDGGAEQHHTGVVDQDVEASELGDGALDGTLGLRLFGKVGLEHERGGAGGADSPGQVIESVPAAGSDGHRGAVPGQRERRRLADPARRAGDQRHGARETLVAHDESHRKPTSDGVGGSGLSGSPGGGSFSL